MITDHAPHPGTTRLSRPVVIDPPHAPHTLDGADPAPGPARAPEPALGVKGGPTPPEHPKTILVADDESLAALSVIHSLRHLGYTPVGPARDGEHAVELAFSSLPDLALLDARMATDCDGLDAARALFNDLMIPVVIVSAYTDRAQVAVAAEAGVFGYLVKPVTKDQLGPAIEVAWSRFNRYLAQEVQVEVLRRHLQDRQDLERAKWRLVERRGLEEGQAAREIRARARLLNVPLAEVARQILAE